MKFQFKKVFSTKPKYYVHILISKITSLMMLLLKMRVWGKKNITLGGETLALNGTKYFLCYCLGKSSTSWQDNWLQASYCNSNVSVTYGFFKIIIAGFIFSTFFIVVQVQLSPFSPTTPPHASHPHIPPSILLPFGFVHVSFILVPENLWFLKVLLYYTQDFKL